MRDRISFNDRYEVIALSEYELSEFQTVLTNIVSKIENDPHHKRSKSALQQSTKSFDT